jgi:hypothetical protein
MIVVYLTNGNSIYLKNCDFHDFMEFVKKMRDWRRNIRWRCMWFRKKDIYSFELVEAKKNET